jgi:hypothetical protein
MSSLQARSNDLIKEKDILDPAISDLVKYEAEYERLKQLPASATKDSQLEGLREKVNQTTSKTGYNTGTFNFNSVSQLGSLDDAITKIKNRRNKTSEELQSNLEERSTAEGSYTSFYDNKKSLIELGLGGTLQSQAEKYKTMSDAQKLQFEQAMADISELNAAMSMMPSEKKIDVELVWKQTGLVPDASTPEGRNLNHLMLRDPGYEGYADGGIATRPSIFGEAGPEIAIPLNTKPRSRSLLEKANNLMGYSSPNNVNEGNIQVTWAPQVTIQGGTPSIAAEVARALQDQQPAFEQRFQRMIQQQRRVSFQ